ncbi:glycosyltransferase WbsX family protein [Paenibacillus sp. D9]|uniref:glycosyltransferase WbsX family protein n=1 Tax=Paenibacillus sp. D9 TaxID=665792 RepID=UPI0006768F74|nr:glycoside hydrolase family 99-like domain-containing protein [Paenibacillus sp. D9]
MKLIAYLLPQFHPIPENDRSWGKGFTEWTNTRKAKPLYAGHEQPREPLHDYYYDLTSPEAREWQASLAARFGIYGFCYYHYWFKGKKLLQQPMEEILSMGTPNFPFCFSWANESWTKKWDGGDKDIIVEQQYGTESDWKEHFNYLLNFFLDPRYIRIDGKPVFLIYRPGNMPCWEEMRRCWNRWAEESGLPGLYWIRTLGGFPVPKQHGFDASVEFEPHYTFATSPNNIQWRKFDINNGYHHVFDYDQVWNLILNRSRLREGEPIMPGAFVGWDNTPRLKSGGQSCVGGSPEKFGWYLSRQIRRAAEVYKSDFLFINAWNEWAEGTYLEPDKRHGDLYLQELRKAAEEAGSQGSGPRIYNR